MSRWFLDSFGCSSDSINSPKELLIPRVNRSSLFSSFLFSRVITTDKMLEILRHKLEAYKNINLSGDFATIFNNGLIFCALIHTYDSNLIKYDALSKENGRYNLELALSVAEAELGVTKLLDASDFEGVVDELSVMTYLSSLLEVVSVCIFLSTTQIFFSSYF